MMYRYTDGYVTVSKQEAFKAFKNGKDVRIGYQHKDDGAYWNFNQFINEMKGDTAKEKFESVVYHLRYHIIPHTRLKYAIKDGGFNMGIYHKYDDEELEAMWDELEDVPIDENECLDVDWNGFSKGTHREEIWYWFDMQHTKGVGWLMNEYEKL